jgi:hypothetical protein
LHFDCFLIYRKGAKVRNVILAKSTFGTSLRLCDEKIHLAERQFAKGEN